MEYQNKLSRLRQAFLKLQGQDLKQVLLRAAAKRAEEVANNVYTTEEIFHAISEKIYKDTNELSWNEAFVLASDAESLAILKKELIESVVENFEWEEMLHVLLDGLEGTERIVVQTVLNNQHMNMLAESSFSGTMHDTSNFNKLLIPIVRKIFKNFEALKLVGVQPMTGPVGMAYLLRYRELDEEENRQDITDNTEAFAGRKISLEVVSEAHEASSRQLQAGWTMEAIQDLNSFHGLDLAAEMSQAIAAEIQDELTAEIVNDLHKLSGDPIEIELDGFDPSAPLNIAIHINKAANDIAVKTRRGAGNWVVVPPTIVSMFESLPNNTYKQTTTSKHGMFGSLMEVGTLNGCIKVFSSLTTSTDEILVGYKGGNGESDTGYVYAPYMPVLASGVVVDPDTFQPVIRLMTRSGKVLNGGQTYDEEGEKIDVPPKAQNYYSLIKIKGNLFTEEESSGKDS